MTLSHGPGMTIGERIKEAREAKGWSQARLATEIGASDASTIGQAERRPSGPGRDNLVKIAAALDVSVDWLATGVGEGPKPQNERPQSEPAGNARAAAVPLPDVAGWPTDLPVYGTAQGGPDGAFELNSGDIIEWVRRPPYLARVAKAYAVYCEGTSMVPLFEPGDLVCVHPSRPVAIGDYVLIQLHPSVEGDNPTAFLKRLVRRTADRIEVEQLNGGKRMTFGLSKILHVHYVVRPSDLLKG
jgi:phage repressor protein C with HTH and peptisase S24 domain